MKTCDECANYECDNFDGVGWCNLNKAMVLHDDPTCKEFNELPEDGEKKHNNYDIRRIPAAGHDDVPAHLQQLFLHDA